MDQIRPAATGQVIHPWLGASGDQVTVKYYRNDVLKQAEATLVEKPSGS
jgi:arginyl-tRNA synthetase